MFQRSGEHVCIRPNESTLTELTSIALDNVLANWQPPESGELVNCSRAGFSADYTKLLFSGDPPGQAVSHIGYVDLTDGSVHDLTDARQQSGFSSTLLDESDPMFLGPGGGRIAFGGDQVAFIDTSSGISVTSISNPEIAKQIYSDTTATQWDALETAHPELDIDGQDSEPGSTYNPTFTLQAIQGPDGTGGSTYIEKYPSTLSPVDAPCPLTVEGDFWQAIGWEDDTHVVLQEVSPGGTSADGIVVVTVDPQSLRMHCGPNLLPSNNRMPSGLALTTERNGVIFVADVEAGGAVYLLPLSGGLLRHTRHPHRCRAT